jgi:hypothetical protein
VSFIYIVGHIYVAVSYNNVLSALKDIRLAHVRSVTDGGEGKKRSLGHHTFYDHEASFAFCRGILALTPHSSTFCHLSCGRSEPGSEKGKRFCVRLNGPLLYAKDEMRR